MSILVEIAEKADVPVEGVIRVLTREPVSDAVMERVLAVLDDLTPEQTRAVQRFALAALHDVLPRPLGAEPEGVNPGQLALSPASERAVEQPPVQSPSDAALVQLSGVLSELAEAVRDLRRETDEERRERVDDLAVLIDLITTGWQGLDARLGRIEKQISRLDASRRHSAVPLPVAATPVPPAAPADIPPAVEPPAAEADTEAERRSRLPLAAALTLAGAVIGTFAVLQLDSGGADVADLVSARDEPAQTTQDTSSTTGAGVGAGASSTVSTTTTAGATTRTRPSAARQPVPTTSSVLGTTVGKTQSAAKPKPPAATPTTKTTTTSKPQSPPSPSPPTSSSFEPTRNWAWAPVPDADYYSVEFTRGGQSFYRATPTEPRLTLPGTLAFTAGSYRWIVRPGFGTRAARRLGDPVVNSGFTVS